MDGHDSRSTIFNWVKNLQFTYGATMNITTNEAFALFWNLCRQKLPEANIPDFEKYMGLQRLHASSRYPLYRPWKALNALPAYTHGLPTHYE